MDLTRAQRLRRVPFDLLTPEMQARAVSGRYDLFCGWASEYHTALHKETFHTHLLIWFAELTCAEPGWPHSVPMWTAILTTPLGTISKLYGGVSSTSGALFFDPS